MGGWEGRTYDERDVDESCFHGFEKGVGERLPVDHGEAGVVCLAFGALGWVGGWVGGWVRRGVV